MLVRAIDFLSTGLLKGIGQISLLAVLFLVSADVALRYLLNAPIAGALEISESVPVIVTFCFFAYTAMQERHIRTTYLVERMAPRSRIVAQKFAEVLMLIFLSLLIWRTSLEAYRSLRILEFSQGLIAIPRYPVKILIPMALGVGWLHYVARLFAAPTSQPSPPPAP